MKSRDVRIFRSVWIAALSAIVFAVPVARGADAEVARKVAESLKQEVTLNLPRVPMLDAIEQVAARAGVKAHFTDEGNDAFALPVMVHLHGGKAQDAIDALCAMSGLSAVILADGIHVQVTGFPTEIYDITDLTAPVRDFPPPPGVDVLWPQQYPMPHNITSVADTIRNRVRPDLWDGALGTSIEERGGLLVIQQSVAVHAEIRDFLREMRRTRGQQLALSVQVLAVKSVEVDRMLRGALSPVLDDAAVAAFDALARNEPASVLYQGSTLALNKQLALMQDVRSQRLIVGYAEDGESVQPVSHPSVSGTVASIRPLLSDNGKTVRLKLQVGQMRLESVETVHVQRPSQVPYSGAANFTIMESMKTPPVANGAPAPQAPADEIALKDIEAVGDMTRETTRTIEGTRTLGVFPGQGPLRLQLPTSTRSQVAINAIVPVGKTCAFSSPRGTADGFEPGMEMLVLVRCQPLSHPAPTSQRSWVTPELKAKLDAPVSFQFNGEKFSQALGDFATKAKISVVIDASKMQDALEMGLTAAVEKMPTAAAFDQLMRHIGGSASGMRSVLSVVSTGQKDPAAIPYQFRIFDVSDIEAAAADPEPAPNQAYPDAAPMELANPFGENPAPVDIDLAELIQSRMLPGLFTDPSTSIQAVGRSVWVMNTPENVSRVEAVLNGMRTSLKPSFAATARWALVDSEKLTAILGAGASTTLVDARQAEAIMALVAAEGSRDLSTVRTVATQGVLANSFAGVTRSVVTAYEAGGTPSMRPVVGVAMAGARMEIRPFALGDGLLSLDLRLSLSRLEPGTGALDPIAVPDVKAGTRTDRQRQPPMRAMVVGTTVQMSNGGGVIFCSTPPEWLEGENKPAGRRTAIVLVRAERMKL